MSNQLMAISVARGRLEIRSYLRSREAVLFGVLFPVILLMLFGAIFGNEEVQGVKYAQVLAAGILASAVASTSFLSMAISIAVERDEGTLKRLAITPMPKLSYFFGKIMLVMFTSIIGMFLTLLVGVVMFGVDLPTSPGRWFTFLWVTVLGITSCTLGGVAVSSLIRSAKAAGPVANFPFVILNFLSGVYVSFWSLPKSMQVIGSLFPLKWMAQGYRSVFLPDSFVSKELAHNWEHGRTALVLGAWCMIGVALCVRTFRWLPRER
jgi:ABC-2 type transport system permease protein